MKPSVFGGTGLVLRWQKRSIEDELLTHINTQIGAGIWMKSLYGSTEKLTIFGETLNEEENNYVKMEQGVFDFSWNDDADDDEYYEEPEVPTKKQVRSCLRCTIKFVSDGPGNRICDPCKDTREYSNQLSGYDEFAAGGYG